MGLGGPHFCPTCSTCHIRDEGEKEVKKRRIFMRTDLYTWREPYKKIRCFFQEIKWAYQRAMYGYAYCDVWGIDNYLLAWLPSALEDLAEKSRGHPGTFDDMEERQVFLYDTAARINLGYHADYQPREVELSLRKHCEDGLESMLTHFWELWW